MSAELEPRRGDKNPAASTNDDAVKMLTDILRQVGAGIHPPPLSEEAVKAIQIYKRNRATLDNDIKQTVK